MTRKGTRKIMKKYAVCLSVLAGLLIFNTAYGAAIQYRWLGADFTQNRLTDNDGVDIAFGDATVLTYVSQNTTIDFDTTVLLTDSYGDDAFHSAMGNSGPPPAGTGGLYWTAFESELESPFVGYYIYAVVLNLPLADFTDIASVPAGTYYGISEIGQDSANLGVPMALAAIPPSPAQSFYGGNVQTIYQVIPEPSSLFLLGLGALMLMKRRRV